jgi:hypothetical protein
MSGIRLPRPFAGPVSRRSAGETSRHTGKQKKKKQNESQGYRSLWLNVNYGASPQVKVGEL